jgi:hypothetical protein
MSCLNSDDLPTSASQTISEHLRLIASRPEFDGMQEEAAAKSVRRTLRPRTLVLVGVAGGFAAAMGVSAMAAFMFFVLVPNQVNAMAPDLAASEHLILGSAGAAKITPEESRILLEKFERYLDFPTAGIAKTTPEEARALLDKFVQWQQRQSIMSAAESL